MGEYQDHNTRPHLFLVRSERDTAHEEEEAAPPLPEYIQDMLFPLSWVLEEFLLRQEDALFTGRASARSTPPVVVHHRLPSFQWDMRLSQWVVLSRHRSVPEQTRGHEVDEPIQENELPPPPTYQIGDRLSFRWCAGQQIWCGPIQRILVYGSFSFFTACETGKEEEEGARTRAIERSYHQPQSVEYVVWSHAHTRHVQAHTVIGPVYGEEEEILSFTSFEEELLF